MLRVVALENSTFSSCYKMLEVEVMSPCRQFCLLFLSSSLLIRNCGCPTIGSGCVGELTTERHAINNVSSIIHLLLSSLLHVDHCYSTFHVLPRYCPPLSDTLLTLYLPFFNPHALLDHISSPASLTGLPPTAPPLPSLRSDVRPLLLCPHQPLGLFTPPLPAPLTRPPALTMWEAAMDGRNCPASLGQIGDFNASIFNGCECACKHY